MESRFVYPDCGRWQACLEGMPHDFYHLPEYARLCSQQEHGEPLAFVAEKGRNRFLVPLIIRQIEFAAPVGNGLYDATSPYGYPSPLLLIPDVEAAKAEFLLEAIGVLLETLRQRGVVSLFLRLHPLLPLPLEPFRQYGTLVRHGKTVFHDLTQSEDELWRQTDRRCRKGIDLAKQHGCVAEIDHAWNCFDDFFEIYTQTMIRVGADAYYFFPAQYFHELKKVLHGALHLCMVRLNGTVTSAGMFSEICGIVQAHLVGSRPEFNRSEPTRLMKHFVRYWAKSRGNRLFHLGGGVGGRRDSLFQFKAGFSTRRADFYTFRAVVNRAAYEALVRAQQPRTAAGTVGPQDFFPAYRLPTPGATAG